MSTKPFEPKLPLPETFETELMKNGISQLQPMVNQYLQVSQHFLLQKLVLGCVIPRPGWLWPKGLVHAPLDHRKEKCGSCE